MPDICTTSATVSHTDRCQCDACRMDIETERLSLADRQHRRAMRAAHKRSETMRQRRFANREQDFIAVTTQEFIA